MKFAHLHVHSEFSNLDSICSIKKLVAKAKENGHEALALTDHGNLDGGLALYRECEKNGIKPIIGCECYVMLDREEKDKDKIFHLIVLCKNWDGMVKLMKFLSLCNANTNFLKKDKSYRSVGSIYDLIDICKGDVIVSTACVGGVFSQDNYKEIVNVLHKGFKDDFYLEIMPFANFESQKIVNDKIKEFPIKKIFTKDIHYINPEDWETHEVFLAIGWKQNWYDPNRRKYEIKTLYYSSVEDMVDNMKQCEFDEDIINDCLKNIDEIIDKCNIKIEKQKPTLPTISDNDKKLFFEKIKEGLKKRGFDKNKIYTDRVKREFDLITKNNFETYFLVIADLVEFAKKNMVVGAGRGSVGSVLCAYCMGITEVDPIKYDLPFERFLSEGRIDYPDIDLDFDSKRRWMVVDYLKNKYGQNNVANVSTFSKMHGKSVLKDVSRVFNIPVTEVNELNKLFNLKIKGEKDASLQDVFDTYTEAKLFEEKYGYVLYHARKLEGLIRQTSSHAAGVVVSSLPLISGQQGYIARRGKNETVINWNKDDLEFFGLIKLDVLGLQNLSIISDMMELNPNITKQMIIDVMNSDMDDKDVYENFNKRNVIGVFQFNTYAMREFARQLTFNEFSDLVDLTTLFRPGALGSGSADEYIKVKNGLKEAEYIHPIMKEITYKTQGTVIYQEQVMYILNKLAGIDWSICDKVRKVMAKSKGVSEILEYKNMFVNGCINKKTISEEQASMLFEKLMSFALYSFNMSHSVGYSMLSYLTMWVKIHFPLEFVCASLNNLTNEDKREEIIEEAKRLGVKIKYPNINYSGIEWTIADGKLFCGLKQIKGIGEKTCEEIINKREFGLFEDKEDFLKRVEKRKVNSKVVRILETTNSLFNEGEYPAYMVEELLGFSLYYNEEQMFKNFLKKCNPRKDCKYDIRNPIMNISDISEYMPEGKGEYFYVLGKMDKMFFIQDKRNENKKVVYFHLIGQNRTVNCYFEKEYLLKNIRFLENIKDEYVFLILNKTKSYNSGKFFHNVVKLDSLNSFIKDPIKYNKKHKLLYKMIRDLNPKEKSSVVNLSFDGDMEIYDESKNMLILGGNGNIIQDLKKVGLKKEFFVHSNISPDKVEKVINACKPVLIIYGSKYEKYFENCFENKALPSPDFTWDRRNSCFIHPISELSSKKVSEFCKNA